MIGDWVGPGRDGQGAEKSTGSRTRRFGVWMRFALDDIDAKVATAMRGCTRRNRNSHGRPCVPRGAKDETEATQLKRAGIPAGVARQEPKQNGLSSDEGIGVVP
ncbi:hypothetical protein VCV18_005503 [Metarhizium anisopliae]